VETARPLVAGGLSVAACASFWGVTSREVLQAALALPPEERAQLIEQLEASLPADEEDDGFVAMINERVAAAEAGAPGSPAEQVLAELLRE
jgi:hypothetical protein